MKPKLALRLGIGVALAGLLLSVVVPFFFPWTKFNCWTESMDITCGRYHYERYFFFVKLADRIEETALSRLHHDIVGEPSQPVWRSVNTFSPGVRHSPHYIHHGSLHAATTLTEAFEQATFHGDAQKETIQTFFRLLQEEDRYFRASEYATSVWQLAASTTAGVEITSNTLPQPPLLEEGQEN